MMMRNESPILDPFLDQAEALFDRCIILNHGSTDDSASRVQHRDAAKFSLYHLKAPGYPQSEVATYFAREVFLTEKIDFLFFLDCDEFLLFNNRGELETFLKKNESADVVRLPWLNICPADFEGGNIFSTGFVHSQTSTLYYKAVLNKKILAKAPDFKITQGYHNVSTIGANQIERVDTQETCCIHIPIQSRVQFGFKLANGNNRLERERVNLNNGNGFHWVELAKQFSAGKLDNQTLRSLALNYPDVEKKADAEVRELEFLFPYIKSNYQETQSYISSQIAGLVGFAFDQDEPSHPKAFSVVDELGNVVVTDGVISTKLPDTIETKRVSTARPLIDSLGSFDKDFSSLVEPLFMLPTKLPETTWLGHVPFMFVLFKLLKPETYVELGVNKGASLIAACTAAKSYTIDTSLYGVDSWQGDHDHFEGEQTYAALKTHLDSNFRKVVLMRSLFMDARKQFSDESIDLLHLNERLSYEDVREDFKSWYSAMSPSGVMLFHNICVYDRGLGVYRLWAELKELFCTVEFHHSSGLGVLFLDSHDSRLDPLRALASTHSGMKFYRGLVSIIADVLRERRGFYTVNDQIVSLERHIASLSTNEGKIAELEAEIALRYAEELRFQNSSSRLFKALLRVLKSKLKGHHD